MPRFCTILYPGFARLLDILRELKIRIHGSRGLLYDSHPPGLKTDLSVASKSVLATTCAFVSTTGVGWDARD